MYLLQLIEKVIIYKFLRRKYGLDWPERKHAWMCEHTEQCWNFVLSSGRLLTRMSGASLPPLINISPGNMIKACQQGCAWWFWGRTSPAEGSGASSNKESILFHSHMGRSEAPLVLRINERDFWRGHPPVNCRWRFTSEAIGGSVGWEDLAA